MDEDWTVQDVIDDTNEALQCNATCGEWVPIWERIEEWRDGLAKATAAGLCIYQGSPPDTTVQTETAAAREAATVSVWTVAVF